MNPIVRPWRQVLDFKGRATRTEYGLFHITGIAALVVLELLSVAIAAAFGRADQGPSIAGLIIAGFFSIVSIVLMFAFLIGHISIAIRRLHDHGDPGIKYLLTFIPLIGFIFWILLVFTKGDDYENDYGPDPRQGDQVAVEELGAVFE